MKKLNPEKIIIIDIIIMGIIVIYFVVTALINSFLWLIPIPYIVFIIICILKIIFPIINMIKNKIKPKIYIMNLPLFIVSLLPIAFFIRLLFLDDNDLGRYLIVPSIYFLIVGISSIIYQICYVNDCNNKNLRMGSSILMPIMLLVIIFAYFSYISFL
jgi:CDP-diglyceride synthetase